MPAPVLVGTPMEAYTTAAPPAIASRSFDLALFIAGPPPGSVESGSIGHARPDLAPARRIVRLGSPGNGLDHRSAHDGRPTVPRGGSPRTGRSDPCLVHAPGRPLPGGLPGAAGALRHSHPDAHTRTVRAHHAHAR